VLAARGRAGGCGTHAPIGGGCGTRAPREARVFAATQDWTESHHLFGERPESLLGYDEAALVLPGARTTARSDEMI